LRHFTSILATAREEENSQREPKERLVVVQKHTAQMKKGTAHDYMLQKDTKLGYKIKTVDNSESDNFINYKKSLPCVPPMLNMCSSFCQ